MILKVKKLDPTAIIPTKAHTFDAGWDLYATDNVYVDNDQTHKIKTGIAVEIPVGWFGLICDRSSIGLKGIKVHGGVIDSGYRGEIMVCLNMGRMGYYHVKPGEKIAQLVLLPVPAVSIQEVDQLDETERGDGGFGSTGR